MCGLDDMPEQVARLRPKRLISLLPAAEQPLRPPQIETSDHLRILVDDVDRAEEGFTAPAREHVEALLDFLRVTAPGESILIHCFAGISRSPAAALIAMVLTAPGREREAAQMLRDRGPFVQPNRLLVRLADTLLARDGALVAALEAMGPPRLAREAPVLELPRILARRGVV